MPFILNQTPCKKCGVVGNKHRSKFSKQNQKEYVQSTCVPCELWAFAFSGPPDSFRSQHGPLLCVR